jgi:hypothetical protein
MKKLLFTVILIIGLSSISDAKNSFKISNTVDSIVKLYNKKIEIELTKRQELESVNTELKNQLIIYKAKEDYFAAALGEQASRFSTILVISLTLLVAFLGLISWSWVKFEKKRINEKLDKEIKSFQSQMDKMNDQNIHIAIKAFIANSNVYAAIADSYAEKNQPYHAFYYYLCNMVESVLSFKFREKEHYAPPIENLNLAKEMLNKIDKNDFKKIENKKADIIEYLDIIQECNDQVIRNTCAEIRVKYNEIRRVY